MTPIDAIHQHRRHEAYAGWPTLTAIPNTFVVRQLTYLERLEPSSVDALLSDWEGFAHHASAVAKSAHELIDERRRFPAYAYCDYMTASFGMRSAATFGVKVVAGVLEEPTVTDLAGWADLLGLPPEAARLRPSLARSVEDLVPVAPRVIRSGLKRIMKDRFDAQSGRIGADHTRFEGTHCGCHVSLDVLFAAGWSKHTKQIEPHAAAAAPEHGGHRARWKRVAQVVEGRRAGEVLAQVFDA